MKRPLSRTKSRSDSEQCGLPGQWPTRFFRPLFLLVFSTALGGCLSLPLAPADDAALAKGPIEQSGIATNSALVDTAVASATARPFRHEADAQGDPTMSADLWERVRAGFRLKQADHPRVLKELERLQRHPNAVHALLKRATPYLHHIVEKVEQRDLPLELALLPAVESGFRPFAHSPNGAAGLWQFMPATGRMLGLEQNPHYDGRRDVTRSTQAALDYLTQLHGRLGDDWLHALAAYNCGIGTVKRAIRRAHARKHNTSYWKLDLPAETDAYVPRLLALARIVANPERYGVKLPHLANKPYFNATTVQGALDLEIAAELAGIPLKEFQVLNPAYRQGMIPARKAYKVLLPRKHLLAFEQALADLPRDQWLRSMDHRVRPGDTLIAIARRYRVSVDAIRDANAIQGHHIRVDQRLRIPLAGRSTVALAGREKPRSRVRYEVRKGDSLYTIARQFSVSIAQLKRWNNVGRYIRPGQELTVYVSSAG